MNKFLENTSGNFAVTMAVVAVPLLISIGAAVDYTYLVSAESKVQNAADSAALAAARKGGKVQKDIEDIADGYFEANLESKISEFVTQPKLSISKNGNNTEYTYSATVQPSTSIMGVIGINAMSRQISSTAIMSSNEYEIALVLDSTGSMGSNNKMPLMHTAVKNFITHFEDTGANAKISIVPFDTQVRVKDINFTSTELNAPGNPYGSNCGILWGTEKTLCVAYQASCIPPAADPLCIAAADEFPDDALLPEDCTLPAADPTAPICSQASRDTKGNDLITANNDLLGVDATTWSGCLVDRLEPFDASYSAPSTADEDTLYPAAHCAAPQLATIMPLSNKYNLLRNHVDTITPSGNTNITIGMQWGMETLTKNKPFSETMSSNPSKDIKQIIVLLTDGVNTQNRNTTYTASIDARTKAACDNAKTIVKEVYTVRVMDGNAALLQDCASSPKHFFNVTDATQLDAVFNAIAEKLTAPRLIN